MPNVVRRVAQALIPPGDTGPWETTKEAARGVRSVYPMRLSAVVLVCLLAAPAAADTLYKFVDGEGTIHFSNTPNDPRYRAVATLGKPAPGSSYRRTPQSRTYDPLIERTALTNGVPPALVKAVIAAESAFDVRAVSHKGAQGLMQLMPDTADALGVRNPFRAEENVSGGTRYLRSMLDRYGDMERALAAYNAGPTAVDRHRGIPPYRETQEYVERVLAYYRRYDADFPR